jgi:hypothetical protein
VKGAHPRRSYSTTTTSPVFKASDTFAALDGIIVLDHASIL